MASEPGAYSCIFCGQEATHPETLGPSTVWICDTYECEKELIDTDEMEQEDAMRKAEEDGYAEYRR